MKYIYLIASILLITNIFAQKQKAKIYPFKSAIIEYKYEAQLSGTHIKYIDDYGYKQADYIRKEINLGDTEKKYETIFIYGNRAYTLNPLDTTIGMAKNNFYPYYFKYKNKTGVEINEAIEASASGWKFTGTKQFLGKECKVWESGKSIRYTWNSIILYEELNFMVMMVENATKIETDVKIPADKFAIPNDYKYSPSTGQQIGFSDLDLNFNKIKLVETKNKEKDDGESQEATEAVEELTESNSIKIEFNSDDYMNSKEYTYYNEKGDIIKFEGINNYNSYDFRIIKSQERAFLNKELNLSKYNTAIFKTSKGDYGKMQITKLEDDGFSYQFIIFNKNCIIKEYSKNTSDGLKDFFAIKPDERNRKLIITPIKTSTILIIE